MNYQVGDCLKHICTKNKRFWFIGMRCDRILCLTDRYSFDTSSWTSSGDKEYYDGISISKFLEKQFTLTWCWEENLSPHQGPIQL